MWLLMLLVWPLQPTCIPNLFRVNIWGAKVKVPAPWVCPLPQCVHLHTSRSSALHTHTRSSAAAHSSDTAAPSHHKEQLFVFNLILWENTESVDPVQRLIRVKAAESSSFKIQAFVWLLDNRAGSAARIHRYSSVRTEELRRIRMNGF